MNVNNRNQNIGQPAPLNNIKNGAASKDQIKKVASQAMHANISPSKKDAPLTTAAIPLTLRQNQNARKLYNAIRPSVPLSKEEEAFKQSMQKLYAAQKESPQLNKEEKPGPSVPKELSKEEESFKQSLRNLYEAQKKQISQQQPTSPKELTPNVEVLIPQKKDTVVPQRPSISLENLPEKLEQAKNDVLKLLGNVGTEKLEIKDILVKLNEHMYVNNEWKNRYTENINGEGLAPEFKEHLNEKIRNLDENNKQCATASENLRNTVNLNNDTKNAVDVLTNFHEKYHSGTFTLQNLPDNLKDSSKLLEQLTRSIEDNENMIQTIEVKWKGITWEDNPGMKLISSNMAEFKDYTSKMKESLLKLNKSLRSA